jgi:hypothetical protein
MFTAALLTIAKLWKQPGCPTADEWIKKMYLYKMEFYSATKKNEILSFSGKWISFLTQGHKRKMATFEARSGSSPVTKSASALVLHFPASRTVKNKGFLFRSHAVYSSLKNWFAQYGF